MPRHPVTPSPTSGEPEGRAPARAFHWPKYPVQGLTLGSGGANLRLAAAAMKIGDIVRYRGRCLVLRGFTPMSVPRRQAELADVKTGVRITVPLADVKPVGAEDLRPHPKEG